MFRSGALAGVRALFARIAAVSGNMRISAIIPLPRRGLRPRALRSERN